MLGNLYPNTGGSVYQQGKAQGDKVKMSSGTRSKRTVGNEDYGLRL